MNKPEIIKAIATETGMSIKDSEKALEAFVTVVENALVKGEKVQLVGFGGFEVKERAERKARNPQTKEEMIVPASKAPVFKFSKNIKLKVKEA